MMSFLGVAITADESWQEMCSLIQGQRIKGYIIPRDTFFFNRLLFVF